MRSETSPESPILWRSGGAESVCEWISRFIARVWFDSPHLHHPTPGFRWKPGVCLRVTAVGYELLKADSSMRMLSVTRWRLNRRLRTVRMLRRRHKLGLRVKMCVWLGVSRGLDLAFLNAD